MKTSFKFYFSKKFSVKFKDLNLSSKLLKKIDKTNIFHTRFLNNISHIKYQEITIKRGEADTRFLPIQIYEIISIFFPFSGVGKPLEPQDNHSPGKIKNCPEEKITY